MSKISNIPKKNNPLIRAIRGTLEHRAQWLYLILKEVEKKGIAWEAVGAPAIGACGSIHGQELVRAGKTNSFLGLKKKLFNLPARMVFEMKILNASDDALDIDFGYCPLVGAWQKMGCDDDEIERLCDIAMEGDRGIAKAFGGRLELGQTIAQGHDRCELRFKKGGIMADSGIRLEREGKIAVVTMDREERKNAFDADMFQSLAGITREIEADLPRAVVLTGAGKAAFSAGFDVNLDNPMTARLLEAVNARDEEMALTVVREFRQVVDDFVTLPVPVIGAVNGLAYGGGAELAVRCDMRIMDETAGICFSEVRLGLMPDWGGGACLSRLIGTAMASELILTARVVGAKEAKNMGLVNQVSGKGKCLNQAMELAGRISRNGPGAVVQALSVIRGSREMPLEQALESEARAAARLIVSGECIHGITAFMEKRAPEFPD